MSQLPYMGQQNGIPTLFVDDKPFIALGGEIHNSSSSSLEYMETQVWPHLRGLHLNTVILPIYWELLEPEQGQFDFTLVDGLLAQARRENVRLVLLWFGLWKNGESFYVPEWVKLDTDTYFRACYPGKIPSNTISPLCEAGVKADATAFTQLMRHLREVDGEAQTVIMVQVENEIGFLKSDRDYSAIGETCFAESIPAPLAELYQVSGDWSVAFGEQAPEMFMAWHYAKAVEAISAAGSLEYPLPLCVNAWLEQHPERPGVYPSGGPIARLMPLWKLAAPTLSLYAPDIYLADFAGVCAEYVQHGNPLFIPEARRDTVSATNVFYAIGKHAALCFSPFGIEDFLAPPRVGDGPDPAFLAALNIDFSGFFLNGTGPLLTDSYKLLHSMMPLILQHRGKPTMTGFVQQHESGCLLHFPDYDLQITYGRKGSNQAVPGGLIIERTPGEFILAGVNYTVTVLPKKGETAQIGYLRYEEGTFADGEWQRGRVLNGDETMRVGLSENVGVVRLKVYKY